MDNTWNAHYLLKRTDNNFRLRSVCCPDLTLFSNVLIDIIQKRAFSRLLRKITVPPDGNALDVGCGGGRWVTRFGRNGIKAYGLDISIAAFDKIDPQRKNQFVVGAADSLSFRQNSVFIVSDITVIQHLQYKTQESAGLEIARVLKKNGFWLLLEHLTPDNKGADEVKWTGVYPRSSDEWRRFVASKGMEIIAVSRFHYMPFTQAMQEFITRIEKVYVLHKKKKASLKNNPTDSIRISNNSSITSKRSKPKKRHLFYGYMKARLLDFPMIMDFFIASLLEEKRGTHIALLARKQ